MEMSAEMKKLALEQKVSKNMVNQLLYKYIKCDENSDKIFIDHTLLFTHPNKFNDPFDCWAYLEEPDFNGLSDIIENSNEDELYKKECRDRIRYYGKKEYKESVDNALSKIGVCCFSKNRDNILMWSHYSNNHKGICLQFDILEDTDFFSTAIPVSYVNRMPLYNHFSDRKLIIEKIIQPKSIDWIYEQEVRIVKTNVDIENNEGNQVFKFKPIALRKIIFGCKATQTTIEKYKRLCNVKEFKHVKFSKMEQMTDGTFGLIEKEIL